MSITATIPYYLLSNSHALNRLLENGEREIAWDKLSFWKLMGYTAFMQRDSSRPNHVYEKRWNKIIQDNKDLTLSDILLLVGKEYLTIKHGSLYAKEGDSFIRWQNMRSRMSTLPIKARFLYENRMRSSDKLAHPFAPRLADHIKYEGLSETHLHVNLFTFPEENWLYFIYDVSAFVSSEYRNFYETKSSRKYYMSIHPELTPTRLANRMKLAARLRNTIIDFILSPPEQNHERALEEVLLAIRKLSLSQDVFIDNDIPWIPLPGSPSERFRQERDMWYHAFRLLNTKEFRYRQALSSMLHLYLLLQNEFIRLYRHNENGRGFDIFNASVNHDRPFVGDQEYYQTSLKRIVESTQPREKTCIELRITPSSLLSNAELLHRAWQAISKEQKDHRLDTPPPLILVAHFIKKDCTSATTESIGLVPELYGEESDEYLMQAADFSEQAQAIQQGKCFMLGIDAAGSETKTPPEVFAPAFRLIKRRIHLEQKTYHCGEDFHHLISGIRAIYEAIDFLELGRGSRIGHATAIGIMPERWLDTMPAKIVLSRREWFLDLIFARKFLSDPQLVRELENQIDDLCSQLFADTSHINYSTLEAMFHARRLSLRYLFPEKCICSKDGIEERELCNQFVKQHGKEALDIYRKWCTDASVRKKQNEFIEVKADFLDRNALLRLQQEIQALIARKEITIETLLTSNVRISQYQDHSQHHILRWLQLPDYKDDNDVPMNICMGSDDPGIFVTDIKNEYYLLHSMLLQAQCSPEQAIEHIRRLNETGRIYSFTTIPLSSPQDRFAAQFFSQKPQNESHLFDILSHES